MLLTIIKRFLLFGCLFAFMFVLLQMSLYMSIPNQPVYISSDEIIIQKPLEIPKVPQIIIDINKANEEIKSFSCENVRILIKSNIVAKLKGKIHYEKQKNFRMTYKSIFGLESDIGSNDEHFWFWSKRMQPRSVYYAVHEDLHRTRLKTPFNPLWIMESLSLGAIDTKNIITAEDKNNNLIVFQDRISITGEKVTKSTLIDQKNKRVIGHYVMRLDGTLIASTEIIEFKEIDGISIPAKILIIWHDENVTMEWELSKSKVNQYISDEKWEMPSYDEKVNMGE